MVAGVGEVVVREVGWVVLVREVVRVKVAWGWVVREVRVVGWVREVVLVGKVGGEVREVVLAWEEEQGVGWVVGCLQCTAQPGTRRWSSQCMKPRSWGR
jgi:hypothetical protein